MSSSILDAILAMDVYHLGVESVGSTDDKGQFRPHPYTVATRSNQQKVVTSASAGQPLLCRHAHGYAAGQMC